VGKGEGAKRLRKRGGEAPECAPKARSVPFHGEGMGGCGGLSTLPLVGVRGASPGKFLIITLKNTYIYDTKMHSVKITTQWLPPVEKLYIVYSENTSIW
jgi:hypothetical protein